MWLRGWVARESLGALYELGRMKAVGTEGPVAGKGDRCGPHLSWPSHHSNLLSQKCGEDCGFCLSPLSDCLRSCPTEVSKAELMNANFPLFSKSRLFMDGMRSLGHPPLEEEVEDFKQEKPPLRSC